jgi:hypothetical protein
MQSLARRALAHGVPATPRVGGLDHGARVAAAVTVGLNPSRGSVADLKVST